jgi:hypothetical protein
LTGILTSDVQVLPRSCACNNLAAINWPYQCFNRREHEKNIVDVSLSDARYYKLMPLYSRQTVTTMSERERSLAVAEFDGEQQASRDRLEGLIRVARSVPQKSPAGRGSRLLVYVGRAGGQGV